MHCEQTEFIHWARHIVCPNWRGDEKVLEIGSYNVNGSIRPAFDVSRGGEYVGVDLLPGPDVDRVISGENADYADGYFDVVVSCECFEHNPKWLETFLNMHRMTKDNGCILMTCASSGRREHGTSRTTWCRHDSPGTQTMWGDYYKNLTAEDFEESVKLGELFSDFRFYYHAGTKDLYFVGVKGGGGTIDKPALDHVVCSTKIPPSLSGTKPRHYLWKIRRMFRYYAFGCRRAHPTGKSA